MAVVNEEKFEYLISGLVGQLVFQKVPKTPFSKLDLFPPTGKKVEKYLVKCTQ